MGPECVLDVLQLLDGVGIDVWIDGGWGVDALLGSQSRAHSDLDLIVNTNDASRLRAALRQHGFALKRGGTASNFVLADPPGHEIDVHAIAFDSRGYGVFQLPDGRQWPFPPSAFRGEGRIAGRPVRCLSAEAQVQCHGQGYAATEKDLRDMDLLQVRFGVVLPLALCRQPR